MRDNREDPVCPIFPAAGSYRNLNNARRPIAVGVVIFRVIPELILSPAKTLLPSSSCRPLDGAPGQLRATEPDSTAFSTRGGRKLFPDVEYLVKYKLVKHPLSGRPVCFQDHDCPFPELPDDKVKLKTMIIQHSGKRGPKDQRSGVCSCLNCMNTSARFPGSRCLY